MEIQRELLIEIDSLTSLLAHRYPQGLPEDIIEDLKRISASCRSIYENNN